MGIRAFQLPPIFRLIFDGLIGMMPNILECPRIRSGVVNVVSLLIASQSETATTETNTGDSPFFSFEIFSYSI